MANWCSNWVTLSGGNVPAFMEDVKALEQQCIKEKQGVRLSEDKDSRYLFDFYTDNTDGFSFSTKWSPDFDTLRILAKKHKVTVTNRYEEFGCGIYGEWQCDGAEDSEIDVCLTDDEIDLVMEIDEDNSIWEYNGEQSDCREDLLSMVLEAKIKA